MSWNNEGDSFNVRLGALLTGTLPAAMAKLDRLTTLDLSLNRLTGTVPPTWTSELSSLFTLDLSFNRLVGCCCLNPGDAG